MKVMEHQINKLFSVIKVLDAKIETLNQKIAVYDAKITAGLNLTKSQQAKVDTLESKRSTIQEASDSIQKAIVALEQLEYIDTMFK